MSCASYTTVFTYSQRIIALTFLYGNVRDVDLVYEAIRPQIGVDPSDHNHMRRFLADLASIKYNLKLTSSTFTYKDQPDRNRFRALYARRKIVLPRLPGRKMSIRGEKMSAKNICYRNLYCL